jgi:hypothetical protein
VKPFKPILVRHIIMTRLVLVDKGGSRKDLNSKDVSRDNLYKKSGLRKSDGFKKLCTWPVSSPDLRAVEVWGKTDGRAGTENKYELPPPIAELLCFGTLVIVGVDQDGELCDLTCEKWKVFYDKLFGGFEDLGEDEEESDDELDDVSDAEKTKVGGYLKDGFVVDADDSSDCDDDVEVGDDAESDSEDEDEDEDYESDEPDCSAEDEPTGLGSELEEESYYYSDDE